MPTRERVRPGGRLGGSAEGSVLLSDRHPRRAVAWDKAMWGGVQELYDAVPIALAPVLGNPISLAAAGVDRTLPLQEQARHHFSPKP